MVVDEPDDAHASPRGSDRPRPRRSRGRAVTMIRRVRPRVYGFRAREATPACPVRSRTPMRCSLRMDSVTEPIVRESLRSNVAGTIIRVWKPSPWQPGVVRA